MMTNYLSFHFWTVLLCITGKNPSWSLWRKGILMKLKETQSPRILFSLNFLLLLSVWDYGFKWVAIWVSFALLSIGFYFLTDIFMFILNCFMEAPWKLMPKLIGLVLFLIMDSVLSVMNGLRKEKRLVLYIIFSRFYIVYSCSIFTLSLTIVLCSSTLNLEKRFMQGK